MAKVRFDFGAWLDKGANIVMASAIAIEVSPDVAGAAWQLDYPLCGCVQPSTDPVPDDNPIQPEIELIDEKTVALLLAAGTPELTYLVSFLATAGPDFRRKEVGLLMSCYALRPFVPSTAPPPPPVTTVGGNVTLPEGTQGTINISNTTGAEITIRLPSSPLVDQSLKFKDVAGNAGDHPIHIVASGSTIDNYPEYQLVSAFMSIEIYWMGTQWGSR